MKKYLKKTIKFEENGGKLVEIAATALAGKTTELMYDAFKEVDNKKKVLFITIEETRKHLFERFSMNHSFKNIHINEYPYSSDFDKMLKTLSQSDGEYCIFIDNIDLFKVLGNLSAEGSKQYKIQKLEELSQKGQSVYYSTMIQ